MNIKKNSGLKMTIIFQNQLRNSVSSRILYRIHRKTRDLLDPQPKKNYNLKISNDNPIEGNPSSSFTYLLNDPINSKIYECGLVEFHQLNWTIWNSISWINKNRRWKRFAWPWLLQF